MIGVVVASKFVLSAKSIYRVLTAEAKTMARERVPGTKNKFVNGVNYYQLQNIYRRFTRR
jgi:hypothetical protein